MSAFDLAEKLYREAQNEDEYRAAASRAYTATFQHLMKHPSTKEFHATKTGEDHRLLINPAAPLNR